MPDAKGGEPIPIGVQMWDALTGKEILTEQNRWRIYDRLTFSADSTRLAAAFQSIDANKDYLITPRGVQVWDAITGKSLSTLEDDAAYVNVAAFSPDDTILAAGTSSLAAQASAEVHVWHVNPLPGKRASAPSFVLKGHSSGSISSVAFSPDGRRFVSAALTPGSPSECEVKVWDAATYQELMTLKGPGVQQVVFSGDGRRLLAIETVPRRRILQIWDATPLPEEGFRWRQ
jgi:WD40 repeat protein